jgi:hypothetical protein
MSTLVFPFPSESVPEFARRVVARAKLEGPKHAIAFGFNFWVGPQNESSDIEIGLTKLIAERFERNYGKKMVG